jgi:hypothetical protein
MQIKTVLFRAGIHKLLLHGAVQQEKFSRLSVERKKKDKNNFFVCKMAANVN